MSKFIGIVSAYAYAVSQGYTGTEEEYAELMASYATVAEQAAESAQASAAHSADAQDSAEEASQSAYTASAKATEATTAAGEAIDAKNDAVTAKTAAETAQGKAEDAQAAAESVAESIPSDYSQLSDDVSELKEELIMITEPRESYDVRLIEPNYASGFMNTNGVVSPSTSYKYTEKILVKAGDLIILYKENMSYSYIQKASDGETGYVIRFVTAFNGDSVVPASGQSAAFRYIVPDGIDGVVITVYTNSADENYDVKIRIKRDVIENLPRTFNILDGKKWCACGDSFTEAGYGTGEADLSYYTFVTGRFAGQRKTYPWIIGLRNNMDIANIAKSGMSMANSSGSNAFVLDDYYKNIPPDSDYITLKFGINDVNHGSQLGTIDSTDPTTFYGAWNIVMDYITTNFPYAKVGIIVSNGMNNNFIFVDATIAIAKKWGIPYLDEVYDHKVPLLHRANRPDVCADVLRRKLEAFRVSASNTHPNVNAQYYEAAFVEDWLRTL